MEFQTSFDFSLPKGYVDENGIVHRQGRMRLATADDEINAMWHPKVKQNPDYLSHVVLASVITALGDCRQITPEILESFYTTDILFLQSMYETINSFDGPVIHVTCPHCGRQFTETINFNDKE